jgi:trans-aconitate methyltransferase
MGFVRWFINANIAASRAFDNLLPEKYRIDGNRDFANRIVPAALSEHFKIYDVGGGKSPCISYNQKIRHGLHITGIDIDANELAAAPYDLYDSTLCADITNYRGQSDGDLVIARTVLEHVKDTKAAFAGLASLVKPGGKILVFVPSRNAVFARLNLLLPESLKRKILFAVFPDKKELQGFAAHYDLCTPRDFKKLAAENGLTVEREYLYFISSYFSFFFPAYLIWRLWIFAFEYLAGEQSAETFALVLRKG